MKIISLHPIFNDNAEMLAHHLETEYVNNLVPIEDELYLIYGAHEKCYELLQIQKKTKCKLIIMNSESHKSNFFKNKYYLELMNNNIVLDYNTTTADILKHKHNIKVMGFHWFDFPIKEHINMQNREIDILFIGTPSEKRLSIYKQLIESFPDKNIMFLHNCFDIDKFVSNAKIVLNIPYYDHYILETHRINKALSYGCKVVSLTQTDKFYNDYIYFTDDIIQWIKQHGLCPSVPPCSRGHDNNNDKKTYDELLQQKNKYIIPQIKFIAKYYNLM